eukprot:4900227-Pyramimonas_sp.AAC.1
MRSLAERRGQLAGEGHASSVSAQINFNRLPQEHIDNFLARLDILRNSAKLADQLTIGCEGLSFILWRAVGMSNSQATVSLRRYNMACAANAAQLAHLTGQLRRAWHRIEGAPHNLASAVQSAQQQKLCYTAAPAQDQ